MRHSPRLLYGALILLVAACSTPDLPVSPTAADGLANLRADAASTYMVTFRRDVADVRGVANEMARGRFALDNVREHAAHGFTAHIPPAFVDAIRNDPRVAIFEPDGVFTLDLPRAAARP